MIHMMKTSEEALQDLHKRFPAAIDYLISIFLIDREYGEVSNGRLAARLEVSKPAVSQAIGRLKKLDLAQQDLYGTIRLTVEGRIFAARILKRHYLIEHLLIRKLDYPWDRSDDEAQRLQAAISEEFAEYLDESFDHPQTCPHGNPMPGSKLEAKLINAPRLINAPVGSAITMIRITEEGEMVEGLLKFCNSHQLRPGIRLEIIPPEESDAVSVRCCEGKSFAVPSSIAAHLCWEH